MLVVTLPNRGPVDLRNSLTGDNTSLKFEYSKQTLYSVQLCYHSSQEIPTFFRKESVLPSWNFTQHDARIEIHLLKTHPCGDPFVKHSGGNMTPLIWRPFVLFGGRPNLPRLSLSAFLVWFLSGVILLLSQTMHYSKGNPSKSYICIFWSPQKGNLMPPAFFSHHVPLRVVEPAAPIVHSPHVLELSTFPPGFGPGSRGNRLGFGRTFAPKNEPLAVSGCPWGLIWIYIYIYVYEAI